VVQIVETVEERLRFFAIQLEVVAAIALFTVGLRRTRLSWFTGHDSASRGSGGDAIGAAAKLQARFDCHLQFCFACTNRGVATAGGEDVTAARNWSHLFRVARTEAMC